MATLALRRALVVLVVLAAAGCGEGPIAPPEDPADVEIVTDDVARFWSALDEGAEGDLEGALERSYLGPGTPSLHRFLERRIGSASQLAGTVERNRAYYESVRATTLAHADGRAWEAPVRAAYAELERIEPGSVFPPIALVVGRMNSGGTTSSAGILIGVELVSATPTSPTDTLTSFERSAISGGERLASLIVHEQVHVLQEHFDGLRAADGRSLLERALLEGIADYVAEALTGQVPDERPYTYGRAHEPELWAQFEAEMDGSDISRWLYDRGVDPSREGDLGYFVGYRIAASFAEARGDRDTAIRELVRARDAEEILAASGYDGLPP